MHIDRKLNLVIPIERDTGTVYVHSTPVSRETFDAYFLVIARTYAAILENGLAGVPHLVAMKMMLKVASELGVLDDVQQGLVPEIRRLSNVIQNGPNGWETVPLQEALNRKTFDAEDASYVENFVAFFTVFALMTPRKNRWEILSGAANRWDAEIVSSNCTEYAMSLRTSTGTENIGAKAPPSSIPA